MHSTRWWSQRPQGPIPSWWPTPLCSGRCWDWTRPRRSGRSLPQPCPAMRRCRPPMGPSHFPDCVATQLGQQYCMASARKQWSGLLAVDAPAARRHLPLAAACGCMARPAVLAKHRTALLTNVRTLNCRRTYAQCYGGHQFGHWAGQLGDGRAISLGEINGPGGRYEIQLKVHSWKFLLARLNTDRVTAQPASGVASAAPFRVPLQAGC